MSKVKAVKSLIGAGTSVAERTIAPSYFVATAETSGPTRAAAEALGAEGGMRVGRALSRVGRNRAAGTLAKKAAKVGLGATLKKGAGAVARVAGVGMRGLTVLGAATLVPAATAASYRMGKKHGAHQRDKKTLEHVLKD